MDVVPGESANVDSKYSGVKSAVYLLVV